MTSVAKARIPCDARNAGQGFVLLQIVEQKCVSSFVKLKPGNVLVM